MSEPVINWPFFEDLALRMNEPGKGPLSVPADEIDQIGSVGHRLADQKDWETLLRFASLFYPVVEGESISIYPVLHELVERAMAAAEALDRKQEFAYLWYVEGHNLHRQGYHARALEAFQKSYKFYSLAGQKLQARNSYYMTALCLRALSRVNEADAVLQKVLAETGVNDTWRANPLSILAWLARDANRLPDAEGLLREALNLSKQNLQDEILTASILADLAEVIGLQGRAPEAHHYFEESLTIIGKYQGLYNRQEARVKVKQAELEIREAKFENAHLLLNQADDFIRTNGVFRDMLWKIEMLQALLYMRQQDFGSAVRKMQSAKVIYEDMGLPPEEFLKQITNRLKLGAGFKKPAQGLVEEPGGK